MSVKKFKLTNFYPTNFNSDSSFLMNDIDNDPTFLPGYR